MQLTICTTLSNNTALYTIT
ncbi:hypothetical protein D049_0163A, partial [Vibrio parahaemolyticus VPTS-2010]